MRQNYNMISGGHICCLLCGYAYKVSSLYITYPVNYCPHCGVKLEQGDKRESIYKQLMEDGQMVHRLKTESEYYEATHTDKKLFEIRNNDRNFDVGHILLLEEYDAGSKSYLDRWEFHTVTYMLRNPAYVKSDQVVLGIQSLAFPATGL
jgi:hypothetical protein